MAFRVIGKINSRLKFLYQKDRFLDNLLRRLLCNSLIQPQFDYVCTAWYLNLWKKLKNNLQVTQNKCIRFSSKSQSREHISNEYFHKIELATNDSKMTSTVSQQVSHLQYLNLLKANSQPAEMKFTDRLKIRE